MPRIRSESLVGAHRLLGDLALGWVESDAQSDASRYAFRRGIAHLLAAGRAEDAGGLVTDFEYELARRRSEGNDEEGPDVALWTLDLAAVARRAPRRETRAWDDVVRTSQHLFRTPGWEGWRVLFQAAMDHADDSPVTVAAEAFEASGKRDWAWLRWVNRPKVWQERPCRAVFVGHTSPVIGAIPLTDGRVLSWSRDRTLRLWDGQTGAPLAVLEGHTNSVNGAQALHHSLHLGFSATDARDDLAVFAGGRHLRFCLFLPGPS